MQISNVRDAKANLSKLIQHALAGHEVLIAKHGQPLVKLTPVELNTVPRAGGQWAGQVHWSDQFEFTDEEIDRMLSSPIVPDEDV